MTKIKNYALDLEVRGDDKWIGTDSGSLAKLTKNFTPDNLAKYYNDKEVVESVNQLRFFYDTVAPGEDRARGSFSFPTEVGAEVPFSEISNLVFSRFTLGDDAVNNFMTDIVNSIIILQKADNPDIYAFYALNGYEVDPTDSNFYNVELSYESGNGSVQEDQDYFVSLIQFAGAAGIQTILGSEFIDSTLTGVGEVTLSLSATGTADDTTYLRGDNTWAAIPEPTGDSDFVYFTVKNETGVTINKGKGVMAVGTDGNSGHILIDEMIADGTVEAKFFLGILETSIGNGEFARVISFGLLSQFDTRGQNGEDWNDSDILWCDPANPGDFTIVEPDGPNVKIAAAFILNSSTNGKIQIRVQANEGVHDLHDTRIVSQQDGDVLVWNDTDGVWFNDSTLNVDYTNSRVGIGTTNPSQKLHVEGTILVNNEVQFVDSSMRIFRSSNDMRLRVGGSDRMTINSSGNVGIGTTSPSEKLDVAGNIATSGALLADGIDGIYLNQGEASVFSPTPGIFYSGTAGQGWYFQVPNNGVEKFSFKLPSINPSREFRVVDDSWNPLFQVQGSGSLVLGAYGSGTFTGTATQRLAVDSSGNVIEIPIGSGPVDGSGTANYLAKWSDSDTITDSVIYDNGTDVTIGSTIVSDKLLNIVDGGTAQEGIHIRTGQPTIDFQDWNSGGRSAITSNDANLVLQSDTTNTKASSYISLEVDASEAMRIDSSGNVGIGTTSPSYRLQLDGSTISDRTIGINGDPVVYYPDQSDLAHIYSIALGNGLRNAANTGGNTGTRNTAIGIDSQLNVTIGNSNVSLGSSCLEELTTGDANIAIGHLSSQRSNGSGNVFIGFANSRLFTTGQSNVSIGRNGSYYDVNNNIVTGFNRGVYIGENTKLSAASGNTNEIVIGYQAEGIGSNSVVLGNDSITTTALKGNVGIGTTSPAYKLDIAQSAPNTTAIAVKNDLGNYNVKIGDNSRSGILSLFDSTGAVEKIKLNSSGNSYFNGGNVGIGTTSPGYKLTSYASTAAGAIVASFGNTNNVGAYTAIGLSGFVAGNGANKAGIALKRVGNFGTGELHFLNNNTSDNSDVTLSDSKMMIDTSGNVGIGTTSPAVTLDVASDNPKIRLTDTDGGIAALEGNLGNLILIADNGNTEASSRIAFKVDGSEAMRITDSGNVGIGTTNPTAPLHVDLSDVQVKFQLNNSGAGFDGVLVDGTNASYNLKSGSGEEYGLIALNDGSFRIYNPGGGGYSFTLTNSANIGISKTAPAYRLHLGSGTIGSDASSASNNTPRRIDLLNANTTGMNAYTKYYSNTNVSADFLGQYGYKFEGGTATANKQFQVYVSDAANPRLVVNGSGNVGIGTTSPASEFHVLGSGTGIPGRTFARFENTSIDSAVGAQFYNGNGNFATFQYSGSGYVTGEQFSVYTQEDVPVSFLTNGKTASGGSAPIIFSPGGYNNEKVRFAANGNVGIGTTSPGYKLEVAGTIAQSALGYAPNDDLNDIVYSRFFKTHVSTVNEPSDIGSFGMGINLEYSSGNSMQLMSDRNANTALYMRKQSNGSWGSWLKIRDNNQITDTDISNWDEGYSRWSGATGSNNWDNIDTNAFIKGHTATLNYPPELTQSFLSGLSVLYSSNDGWQLASQRSATASLYHRHVTNGTWHGWRRILDSDDIYVDNSNGNIGIGTTSPTAKLHVEGSTYSTGGFYTPDSAIGYFTNSSSTAGMVTTALNDTTFNSGGAETMRLTASGDVGIGTTSPSTKLHAVGSSNSTSTLIVENDTSAETILLKSAASVAGTRHQLLMQDLSGNDTFSIRNSSSSSYLSSYNGELFLNRFGEDTYIGDYGNNKSLRVRYTTGRVDIGHGSSTGNGFNLLNVNGNASIGSGYFTSSAPVNGLLVEGNVGIGTTSPSTKLHVIGDTIIEDTSAVLALKSTQAGSTSSIQFESLSNAAIIGGGTADYLSFMTASNHRMRILANGNVGIGTTSPGAKLDIINSGIGIRVKKADASDVLRVYTQGSGIFMDNGNVHISDNLGIGTTSPASKLDVNGGIRMADDTATASATNEGTLRYRKDANNSYIDMCMQTGASTYAWVNIKTNTW